MDQPVFWSVLLGASVLGVALRWRNGGPLLARWAVPVGRAELVVAVAAVLVLVFHCAAMFFAPWTDAIPGGRLLGDPVRALGAASQWSYWVPAAALLVALRRIWWPGLVLLGGTLLGVGITMFWPYPLTTHLAWLAAVILAGVFVSSSLVVPGPARDGSSGSDPFPSPRVILAARSRSSGSVRVDADGSWRRPRPRH